MSSPALATPVRSVSRVVRESCPQPSHLRLEVDTASEVAFVDLTARLTRFVRRSGILHGLLGVHTLHTTTSLVLNEAEPLLQEDIVGQLERTVPRDMPYAHDDARRRRVNLTPNERVNGHAHCRALTLGSTLSLSVVGGEILLGRWQRVLFVDLDGPQVRHVAATVVGAAR